MKGVGLLGGLILVVWFVLRMATMSNFGMSSSSPAAPNYNRVSSGSTFQSHSCDDLLRHATQASADFQAGDYRGSIQNGRHGVTLAANCSNPYYSEFAQGVDLLYIGRSEFKRGNSEWKTDLNEAEEHFTKCAIDQDASAHDRAECTTWQSNTMTTSINLEVEQQNP